jgi:hypothetical protein
MGRKVGPVWVEVTGLNPQAIIVSAGNVALDRVGQTVNVVRFDLSTDDKIMLRGLPLEPTTDAYQG